MSNDVDIKKLKLATRKISELYENDDLFTNVSYSMSMSAEKVSFEFTNRPSLISVKAAITDIRHFLMKKSPILFVKVLNTIRPTLKESEQSKLDELYNQWKLACGMKPKEGMGYGAEMVINGVNVNSKMLIDFMINGDILHLDDSKSTFLGYMRGNPMLGYTTMNFIILLQDLAKILFLFNKTYIEPTIIKLES